MAPGSSGFGKETVLKSGSGSACSATCTGSGKPARRKASVSVGPPTPCRAVCTVRTSRGEPSVSTVPVRARYPSTTSSPSTSQPDSGRGTPASGPTAAMRAAISASAGGTICEPPPR
jgi:hypothetical protein